MIFLEKTLKIGEIMKKKVVSFMVTSLCFMSIASAQEIRKLGINLRVDPSPRIGITYHIIDKFVLRPYIGFSWGSEELKLEYESPYVDKDLGGDNEYTDSTEANFTRLTLGIGLFYYIYSYEDLSIYTGIDLNYSKETIDTSVSWLDETYKETGKIIETSLILGLQVDVLKNLALFGEVGFGYSHEEYVQDEYDRIRTRNLKTWGINNSGVGLIFYF